MVVTSKGQITIPKAIRDTAGFLPHTAVEFELRGDEVLLKKVASDSRGRQLVNGLRGSGASSMSTDEIMALTRSEA
jgi:antitoxin PrlF